MVPETPQEQANRISDIAEQSQANEPVFKENVKKMTEDELNALADHFLQNKKDQLSDSVKADIKAHLNTLNNDTVEKNLDTLLDRIPKVREALSSTTAVKTNADQLHQDIDTAKEMVTGTVGSAYEYVKTNILNPLVEKTDGVFLIGPLLKSLTELSPSQIKNVIAKKWYQFLSGAEAMASADTTGFFGKALLGIAKNAKINLAFIRIEEAIAEQSANHPASETITFDKKNVSPQDMQALAAMSETELKDKVISLIVKNRESGVRNIHVTYADLSITQEKLAEQAKAQRLADLEKKILTEPEWITAGVTSVKLNPEETSFQKGVLTIVESDLDPVYGKTNLGSRAQALLDALTTIPSAEKLIIAKDEKDTIIVDWHTPKTVTLPRTTSTDLALVNDIVHEGSLGEFSVLQIENQSDMVKESEVLLERKTIDGTPMNVLTTENNNRVLSALQAGLLKNIDGEPPCKYKFDATKHTFALITSTMPTTSQTV